MRRNNSVPLPSSGIITNTGFKYKKVQCHYTVVEEGANMKRAHTETLFVFAPHKHINSPSQALI